ncbi:amidohydrolase [Mesorhizobium sp. INR15]|uniref:amidohydrolase n=1 Tax=Mesorhizobium sp. INR15 TaxID=2654248 RepID=UPI001896A16C|nr:amidohydrolase [Mesorhizobium sp. INR15]QPC93634.1 amidohydrolase family protein [Mesorhizobium sp. INR15]
MSGVPPHAGLKAALAAFLASTIAMMPVALAKPMVLTNAKIHTVNPKAPSAEAIAIDDKGVILAVGTEKDALNAAGKDAEIIDLGGKMVLPGFQDAHMHLIEAGVNQILCEFEPFGKLADTLGTVEDCLKSSKTDWVLGSGVSMTNLLDEDDNPIALLDEISPDRPVLILDDIGHGAWANSAAMHAAGYDVLSGNPPGGIILRNPKTGKPNGVVLENAQQKLRNLAFPDTPENVEFAYESMLPTLKTMAENGITTVSDAGGFWPQGHVKVWEKALANNTLTVRASNALYVYPDMPFDEQMAALTKLYSNDASSLLRFNQAKIYVDGILEQRTGAVLEPYEKGAGIDHGFDRGFLYFDVDTLNRYSKALSQAGFQLHYHVTGDRGARLALDAIAQSDPAPGPHRLTHLYLVDKTDLPRFKQLGVVADFQLAPSSVDPEYVRFIRQFIGDRADTMMPAGTLASMGAAVVMSSDFDADELSPLIKIQTAAMRKTNGAPDVATAIEWMTINPARLLHQGATTGSLEVGKFADLVVIDRDILQLPVKAIGNAKVVATLLQGKPVYDADHLFEK